MMAVFHFSPTLMALEVGSRRRQPRVVRGAEPQRLLQAQSVRRLEAINADKQRR